MTYQSLYRQYRPLGFDRGYVGQQHIVKTLQNSINENRIGHAYLFTGPRGTGKTTTAKIFAKAVNCLSSSKPVPEPCNQCELCEQVNQGQSLDVMEMDAATNRGIEEIRDLRERVRYAPALGRYKVYIIDEVHMLTTEAFNALLKTLEEPPGHVIFILATTEPHKIPATILSRCQRFDFRPLTEGQIGAHLQSVAGESGVQLGEGAAKLLAFRAQGGMRDALGLLEQVVSFSGGQVDEPQVWEALGAVDRSKLAEFANALGLGDINPCLVLIGEYSEAGVDLAQLLTDLLNFLRQCLLSESHQQAGLSGPWQQMHIMTLMDMVAAELKESKYWLQPRLALEILAVRVCRLSLLATEQSPQPTARIQMADDTIKADPRQESPHMVTEVSDDKWEELLQLVKAESISSYAWLKEADVTISDGEAKLTYPDGYMLHRDNIVKGEHRQNVVPALKKVLGIDTYSVT